MEISKTYIQQLATTLIDELYEFASYNPRIMAINWVAYAYELIYNETVSFMPYKNIKLDGFLNGDEAATVFQIEKLIEPKLKLKLLLAWHELHWLKSQMPEFEDEYTDIIHIRELRLPNFTLS